VREPFDLWKVLDDAMGLFSLRAREQGLKLAWQIHPDLPRMVVGDHARLRQIIMNLVGNAIKFTERGEVALEATAESLSGQDLLLHCVVRDTGIGIPENKQAAIFQMFEQVDSSLARRYGGAGLGLAIAARLVGLMGGRIWVESEVGRGSRFHFTARLDLAPAVIAPPEGSLVSSRREAGRKLRVLLAEDSLVNQKLAVALLERDGHAVTVVDNGRKLLAVLEFEKFDLVLADVQMPEMDGLEATAAIRAKEQQSGGHIPIIALTAHALPSHRAQCLNAGMDGYITKPIRRKELFDAIEAVCAAPRRT
jgi:CheY-like chemotaxis protein